MASKELESEFRNVNESTNVIGNASENAMSQLEAILPATVQEQLALESILRILFKTTNVDFSHYRQTTVLRRLVRRIALCKKNSYTEYLDFIESNSNETELLYDDLLLSYTEFFRDPDVFDLLKKKVFPLLVEHHSAKVPIRIWVPGCSTGEEVYSLAICFQEFIQESKISVKAQFFGTDLNARHITGARAAIYTKRALKNINPERIDQFFDKVPEGFKVTKHIREMCVFAVQNITLDPPFSHMDLVSCRNVLIYFDTAFQETVIPIFHFSLRLNGYLLLGTSESMGRFPQLFTLVDQKINLYSKRFSVAKTIFRFPVNSFSMKSKEGNDQMSVSMKSKTGNVDLHRHIDEILLESFTPPCVVVDNNMLIRQFRGQPFPFLEPAVGEASLKLSKMVGDGLMPELYVLIEEAKKKQGRITKKDIGFKRDDLTTLVDISVVPVQDDLSGEQCFLILFEKSRVLSENTNNCTGDAVTVDDDIKRLSKDLQKTKDHLQSIIEEKDEVNQELWASNEEVQSTNEELQSVNEEMAAAKEELESTNEELLTLNEELRLKNIELKNAKDFSEDIVETAKAIVVTLDTHGRATTFNNYASDLTGYRKDEILGKNWFEIFIHPNERSSVFEAFNDMLNNTIESLQFENHILTKQGSERLISWSNNVLRDHSGNANCVLSIGRDVTEHRQAEIALRESEEKYRILVETSQDLIWQCDCEGRYVYLNRAWETTFGYTLEEMSGKKFTEFQSSEFAEKDMKKFCSLLEGGVAKVYETSHIGKAGNTIHLVFNAVSVQNDKGEIIGTRGTAHDITEWTKAERNYQTLFNEMLNGFALHEIICNDKGEPVDYRFIAVNPAFERVTGLKADDIRGRRVLDVMPQIERDWIQKYGKVALTGTPCVFENYSADLHKHFTVTAFRPAPGQFACIFADITERKESENALKESEFFFKESQRAASIGSYKTDFIASTWESSEVMDAIFGIDKEYNKTLSSWLDIVHPDDRQMMDRYYAEEVIGKRISFAKEYRIIRNNDGKTRWVSGLGELIVGTDGNIVSMIGTILDITDRKETELLLRNSQKLEALGVLAGGIAHDFNNLLGGIFGFIDLANESSSEVQVTKYLDKAMNTIDRARGLTLQLLTFAKGGAPVQKIGTLFPFLQETVQFALSGSNVLCYYDVQNELWPCSYDKNQIGQVIDNIIINALQAMPSGGVIELSACNVTLGENEHTVLAKGEYVKIAIRDYGVGIPNQLLPRIFDPFFTTKAKGNGLGLATCYSIINRHGGCIDVESEQGTGSTFFVFLPATSNAVSLPNVNVLQVSHRGEGTVLVMDDEAVIRDTVGEMLKSLGYSVICKENGTDTIDFFIEAVKTNLKLKAMIFDLTIPGGMGGKEAIVEIRKLCPTIPVFVSSGYAENPVMANPKAHGFTGSICKPFRKIELVKMLSDHFDKGN